MSKPVIYTRAIPACVQSLSFNPMMAVVCAWHENPSKKAGDKWAARHGVPVSHGICDKCAARLILEIA